MRPILSRLAATLALTVGGATTAAAHNAWLEDAGAPDRYVVHYGDHGGKPMPYDAAKLKDVQVFDTEGKRVTVERRDADSDIRLQTPGAALLTLSFDNGYWSRTAEGRSVNRPMDAVPGATSGTRALKYHKRVVAWSEHAARAIGQPYELRPVSTTALAAGEKILIQVLINGKPAQGIPVAFTEDGKEAVTDADGMARLTVKPGRNQIWSGKREPVANDPRATQHSIEYSLFFDAS